MAVKESNHNVHVAQIEDEDVIEHMRVEDHKHMSLSEGPFIAFYVVVTAMIDGKFSMVTPKEGPLSWIFDEQTANDLLIHDCLGKTFKSSEAPAFIRDELFEDNGARVHQIENCVIV